MSSTVLCTHQSEVNLSDSYIKEHVTEKAVNVLSRVVRHIR